LALVVNNAAEHPQKEIGGLRMPSCGSPRS
jgi:hypothetical protein